MLPAIAIDAADAAEDDDNPAVVAAAAAEAEEEEEEEEDDTAVLEVEVEVDTASEGVEKAFKTINSHRVFRKMNPRK